MPIGITAVQIDLDKKNILALTFADTSDQFHFDLEHFKEELVAFMSDPAQVVAVIQLMPGQGIKLIKVDSGEVVNDNPPPDKPN